LDIPAISLVMVQSESGLPATGWVNLGYVDYEFTKNCAYNLQFTVEIEATPSRKQKFENPQSIHKFAQTQLTK